ncbi:helix-turn-helix domain-containing protein (plasmid) [Rhizobium sp. CB3060]|uniref:AraC family transcriptional regulator n=1 Tax=Rhizobium sp. CB3060 TaxID=3138255 RepID=UPI0021A475E6|nr:helix-turn-helix domain-containing protein [Rhizobium tropici]UWU26135.1 helix-turn-helix domain-containing protein [Rhizobium tropici]
MLRARQNDSDPDFAAAPVVGRVESWSSTEASFHNHRRHQLIYAIKGVIHVSTQGSRWVLPPTRALWIRANTDHKLSVARAAEIRVLYVDPAIGCAPTSSSCVVVEVTPLVRELISSCAGLPWDYQPGSKEARLCEVLLDQIATLDRSPVDLPIPTDPRGLRIVDMLKREPSSREPLAALAARVGASSRTIERIFVRETHLAFGAWRQRLRLLAALELLAYGEAVTNVALDVGYESASSFVAAFRETFGTTPARFFK